MPRSPAPALSRRRETSVPRRSEEHTSELQSQSNLVCRLLLVKHRQTMLAFGAEIVLTPTAGGMETARVVAERMRAEGEGIILDQFANLDNPLSHYQGTAPAIW